MFIYKSQLLSHISNKQLESEMQTKVIYYSTKEFNSLVKI